MKLLAHRAGLPGNVDIIKGSAFVPAYKAGHPADLPAIAIFKDLAVLIFKASGMPIVEK